MDEFDTLVDAKVKAVAAPPPVDDFDAQVQKRVKIQRQNARAMRKATPEAKAAVAEGKPVPAGEGEFWSDAVAGIGETTAGAISKIAHPFVEPAKKVGQAVVEGGLQTGRALGEAVFGKLDPLQRASWEEKAHAIVPTFLDPYAESMQTAKRAAAGDPEAIAEARRNEVYRKGGVQGAMQGLGEGIGAATTMAFPGATAIFSAPGVNEGIDVAGRGVGEVGAAGVRAAGGGEDAQDIGRLASKGLTALALAALTKRLPAGATGKIGEAVLGQAAPILGMTAGSEAGRIAERHGAGPGGTELASSLGSLAGAVGASIPAGKALGARHENRARIASEAARLEERRNAPEGPEQGPPTEDAWQTGMLEDMYRKDAEAKKAAEAEQAARAQAIPGLTEALTGAAKAKVGEEIGPAWEKAVAEHKAAKPSMDQWDAFFQNQAKPTEERVPTAQPVPGQHEAMWKALLNRKTPAEEAKAAQVEADRKRNLEEVYTDFKAEEEGKVAEARRKAQEAAPAAPDTSKQGALARAQELALEAGEPVEMGGRKVELDPAYRQAPMERPKAEKSPSQVEAELRVERGQFNPGDVVETSKGREGTVQSVKPDGTVRVKFGRKVVDTTADKIRLRQVAPPAKPVAPAAPAAGFQSADDVMRKLGTKATDVPPPPEGGGFRSAADIIPKSPPAAPVNPLAEIAGMKKAWGRPARAEGTVPTKGEQSVAGRSIEDLAAEAKKATGRDIRTHKSADGSEFLYDAALVKPKEVARREKAGTLWELVGGVAKKPVAPKEAVVVREPEKGTEVRTVLTETPEQTKAAVEAQPEGLKKEVVPATEAALGKVLEERKASHELSESDIRRQIAEGKRDFAKEQDRPQNPDKADKGESAAIRIADLLDELDDRAAKKTDWMRKLEPLGLTHEDIADMSPKDHARLAAKAKAHGDLAQLAADRVADERMAADKRREAKFFYDMAKILSEPSPPAQTAPTPTPARAGEAAKVTPEGTPKEAIQPKPSSAKEAAEPSAAESGVTPPSKESVAGKPLNESKPSPKIEKIHSWGEADYWKIGGEVYRAPKGAEFDTVGHPMGKRWESSVQHFERARDQGLFEPAAPAKAAPSKESFAPRAQEWFDKLDAKDKSALAEDLGLPKKQGGKMLQRKFDRLTPEQKEAVTEYYRQTQGEGSKAEPASAKAPTPVQYEREFRKNGEVTIGDTKIAMRETSETEPIRDVPRSSEGPDAEPRGGRGYFLEVGGKNTTEKPLTFDQAVRAADEIIAREALAQSIPKKGKRNPNPPTLGSMGANAAEVYKNWTPEQKAIFARLVRAGLGVAAGEAIHRYRTSDDDSPAAKVMSRIFWWGTMVGAFSGAPPMWKYVQAGMAKVGEKVPEMLKSQHISPEFADLESGRSKDFTLIHDTARRLAKELPVVKKGADEWALHRFLGGEKGAAQDFDEFLNRFEGEHGTKARAKLEESAKAVKDAVSKLADEQVAHGGLHPETRKKYIEGFLRRVMMQKVHSRFERFMPRGSGRGKVQEHAVREDAHGTLVDLPGKVVDRLLEENGIRKPSGPHESYIGTKREALLQWEPTADGKYQQDLFDEALREHVQSEAARRKVAAGRRGGISHIRERWDPMPKEVREVLGEITNPKVNAYLTVASMGANVLNLKFYEAMLLGKDARGDWAKKPPKGLPAGETFTEGDIQYVRVPKDGSWGVMKDYGMRKDIYDVLSERREEWDDSLVFFDSLMGKWRKTRVATNRGTIRNFLGSIKYDVQAGVAPWKHPIEFAKTGARFLKAFTTRSLDPVKEYMDRYNINVHDTDAALGDRQAEAMIRDYTMASMDLAKSKKRAFWKAAGDITGDVLTFGQVAPGVDVPIGGGKHLPIPGQVFGAAGGAAGGALYGLMNGDDTDEILRKAGIGAGMGALGNTATRLRARAYPLWDAWHKAYAGEVMTKKQGKSLAEARQIIREQFQDYDHQSKVVKTLAGRGGGGLGTVMRFAGNPFLSFMAEEARITKNTFKRSPGMAIAGMMALPIIEAAAVGGTIGLGYLGKKLLDREPEPVFKDDEEKRAAREVTQGRGVPYRRGGGLESLNVGNIWPGGDQYADAATLFSNEDPDGGRSALRLAGVLMGNPWSETAFNEAQIAVSSDPRHPRLLYPLVEPGESKGHAAMRVALEEFAAPSAPYAGTDFQRMRKAGFVPGEKGDEYKSGKRFEKTEPLREALSIQGGMNTQKVDFGKVAEQIQARYSARIREANDALSRAMKESNIATNAKEVSRVVREHDEAIKRAGQDYVKELRLKLPQKRTPASGAGK